MNGGNFLSRLFRSGPKGGSGPDIPVQEAAHSAADALRRHGCALIRTAFEAEKVTAIKPWAMPRFEAAPVRFYRLDEIEGPAHQGYVAQIFSESQIITAMAAYLEGDAVIMPFHASVIRYNHGENQPDHLAWHQDESAGIENVPELTCWLPIDPKIVGETAPGLEVLPRSDAEMLPLANPGAPPPDGLAIDSTAIKAAARKETPWLPVMAVGDAMLFSGRTPHRTGYRPGMTEPRLSVEVRFWPDTEQVRSHFGEIGYFEIRPGSVDPISSMPAS